MAFQHGKLTRLWVDQYEVTSFFNEFTMAAKAGVADTTVFGKGAKSFIGGLKEGTITGKGFFDAQQAAQDQEMAAALGRANNMNVSGTPSGAVTSGTRAYCAYAAETDYSITNPVNNVVATSFSAQADSGLATGVFLYNPDDAAVTTATTVGNASSAYTSGANTATVTVASTTGFFPKGTAIVPGATPGVFTYTGLTGTQFTGCTFIQASVTPSGNVVQAVQDTIAASTTRGLICNFHVLTLTGTGANGTVTPKLQHSSDAVTWVDLIGGAGAYAFAQTAYNTLTAPAGPGATVGLVPANVTINQYLRLLVTTTVGTTLSTTFFATAARQ